jgi:hypothetical protein
MGSSFSSVRSKCPSHLSFLSFSLSFRHAHKLWHAQVAFCVKSCVVLNLHRPHPLPLFFCLIVLGIIIVCNAKGQHKEQGGRDCSRRLKNSSGQPHSKEQINVIIMPPAFSPIVPSTAARTKKKRKKATAPAALVATSNHALTVTPMPSTSPTRKKGKQS